MGKYASFSKSYIRLSPEASRLETKAAKVLDEEIEKRTGIKLYNNSDSENFIYIGCEIPDGINVSVLEKEGYAILISNGNAYLIGSEPKCCLYAVGRLLRLMKWDKNIFELPTDFSKIYSPQFSLRGHQLGYRQKTNAYDAWNVDTFEQYIRELVLFGANSIEILPPRTDDDGSRELMKYDQLDMMCRLSEIIHSYGADVWVWYPYLESEFDNLEIRKAEETERLEVFEKVPYIDHVFIPGGDPGRVSSKDLFACGKWVNELLKKYHPNAKVWLSPQTGTPTNEWVEGFYEEAAKLPEWLGGLVFAPWEKDSPEDLRRRIPEKYPIRNYPDITHMMRSQYPVPYWDLPYALTLGRECDNPRPVDQKIIHNLYKDLFIGSICYSEGINDDVNKFIWLDQEWDSETDVVDTLRDYSGLFIDWSMREKIAEGFMLQEESLRGRMNENTAIDKSFEVWTELEKSVGGYAKNNYRFEMGLIRAYFDKYQRERFIFEQDLEIKAFEVLKNSTCDNIDAVIDAAETILKSATGNPIGQQLAEKAEQLADLLFEHIGAQLTVTRHHAAGYERGAYIDSLNVTLNDSKYILFCLKKAKSFINAEEKCSAVMSLVNRTNPGEGGYYVNFESYGNCWEHIEKETEYENDPAFLNTPLPSFLLTSALGNDNVPLAWRTNVYTLYGKPLTLNFDGLAPDTDYWYRATYAKYQPVDLSLYAGDNGEIAVHSAVHIGHSFCTVQLKLPKEAYRNGRLVLKLTVKDGQRGPNISELMITKKRLTQDGEIKISFEE